MSGYILCQTKKAEVPYFVENISTNIYTIEELCYYLYHNLYLIDHSIMNEELLRWLQEELNLSKLAAKLRPRIGKFSSAEDFLYPIFKEINYLTYEELKELNGRLTKLDQEPLVIREKKKGDTLMKNAMYVHAMEVYQKLLEKENLEDAREGLTASVYYNLGCAYSYLFQMEKAIECFRSAYESKESPVYLKSFLLAYRSVRTPIEYESMLSEMGADADMRASVADALERFARKPEKPVYTQHIDEILEKLTREYHRSTRA